MKQILTFSGWNYEGNSVNGKDFIYTDERAEIEAATGLKFSVIRERWNVWCENREIERMLRAEGLTKPDPTINLRQTYMQVGKAKVKCEMVRDSFGCKWIWTVKV